MIKRYLAIAIFAQVLALGLFIAFAARSAEPELQRIEAYLNSMTTVKASFSQTSSNGQTANGTVYISRPGKMRIEYTSPHKDVIVAAGGRITYWDSGMETMSNIAADSTPLPIILRSTVSLSGDVKVLGVNRVGGGLNVTLSNSRFGGRVTLAFDEQPMRLRGWNVVDAQGISTTVALGALETGVSIPRNKFQFFDPRQGK